MYIETLIAFTINSIDLNLFRWHEVDNYARRASVGNLQGKNVKYKPRLINAINFTPKLKEELRTAGKEKVLDLIVTEVVFQIFKARHKLVFYEHIQPHKLEWEIINL